MLFEGIIRRTVEALAEAERNAALADRMNRNAANCVDRTVQAVDSSRRTPIRCGGNVRHRGTLNIEDKRRR